MKRNVSTAVAALALAGCLVPVAAFAADSVWSMDADCASCHAKEAQTHVVIEDAEDAGAADVGDAAKPASKDAAASEPTAAGTDPLPLAAVHQAVPCTGCHSDEKALSTVHDGVTADSKLPKRLRKAKIDEALCLGCHGSYEDLAEKTADCTVLTDSAGTVVNPHDLPEGADHAKIDCLDCHTAHKVQEVSEATLNTCTGCHHTGVFECGTCH